jgi:hypothetical protein
MLSFGERGSHAMLLNASCFRSVGRTPLSKKPSHGIIAFLVALVDGTHTVSTKRSVSAASLSSAPSSLDSEGLMDRPLGEHGEEAFQRGLKIGFILRLQGQHHSIGRIVDIRVGAEHELGEFS